MYGYIVWVFPSMLMFLLIGALLPIPVWRSGNIGIERRTEKLYCILKRNSQI